MSFCMVYGSSLFFSIFGIGEIENEVAFWLHLAW